MNKIFSFDQFINEGVKDNHPIYKKLDKFFLGFPDDATEWDQATDEIMDMARTAREYYTDIDLDMLYDEWETNPNAPQPLDFTKMKTPAEHNTQGKKYILDTLSKMSKNAKDNFMKSFEDWFK